MTIALCIPHAPWIKARRVSLARLVAELEPEAKGGPENYKLLTDRAPNNVWSVQMWKWMLDTNAEFCLTLQDDAIAAPFFWPALRAMLSHLPKGSALGLSSVHPIAAEVARRGHRWFRTTSWVIGWASGMWREDLEAFYEWRTSEEGDAFARDTWHPTPTIVDHDVSVDSSYDNDVHGHRRPWVTWHRYHEADLTRPDFWIVNGRQPQHFHTVPQNLCWWCMKQPPVRGSEVSGARICAQCLVSTTVSLINERAELARTLGLPT